jgi:hypothetical protein
VAGLHVVVSDDVLSGSTARFRTLTVDVQTDPTGAGNDDALTATELGSQSCNSGFGTMMTRTGYLAASGDNDWYALDVSGCNNGVIEYSVDFDNPGALPTELTTQVRLVREVDDQSCSENAECGKLTAYPCVDDVDCQYVGNDCDASGFCAGAGLCLDTGTARPGHLRHGARPRREHQGRRADSRLVAALRDGRRRGPTRTASPSPTTQRAHRGRS